MCATEESGPHTKVTERIRLGGQLVVSPESKQLRETDDGPNPGPYNARRFYESVNAKRVI